MERQTNEFNNLCIVWYLLLVKENVRFLPVPLLPKIRELIAGYHTQEKRQPVLGTAVVHS
jgi:hypothetical protein